MRRLGPSRLPGDPRSGDEDFGALGGFVDDVFFWIRNRERGRELEADRLAGATRRPAAVRSRRSRLSAWLRSVGRGPRGRT
jgi:hypothetical protein